MNDRDYMKQMEDDDKRIIASQVCSSCGHDKWFYDEYKGGCINKDCTYFSWWAEKDFKSFDKEWELASLEILKALLKIYPEKRPRAVEIYKSNKSYYHTIDALRDEDRAVYDVFIKEYYNEKDDGQ